LSLTGKDFDRIVKEAEKEYYKIILKQEKKGIA